MKSMIYSGWKNKVGTADRVDHGKIIGLSFRERNGRQNARW